MHCQNNRQVVQYVKKNPTTVSVYYDLKVAPKYALVIQWKSYRHALYIAQLVPRIEGGGNTPSCWYKYQAVSTIGEQEND